MGVEEAIEAAKLVGVNKILGVHYDTFGFIDVDHEKATTDFTNANLQLYLPKIGSTIEI